MNRRTLLLASLAVPAVLAPALPAAAAGTMMTAHPKPLKVGELEITAAFARATLPGAPTGGAYLTIANKGTAPDTLVSVSSPAAGKVSLHTMHMDGSVMKMEPVPGGIQIPAGQTVTMAPDGLHMMFEHLTQPFVQGHAVPVTLTFAHAGSVEIRIPVLGIAAKSAGAADAMPGMAM
jgi:copper(I)-binding protein